MLNAIGVLESRPLQDLSERNDALLKAAYLYGVPAYAYTVQSLSEYLKTGILSAVCWENGTYRQCEIELPRYTEIYYRALRFEEMYPEEYRLLSEQTVLTDVFGLPKYVLQQKMLASELSAYAIPTFPIRAYSDLAAFRAVVPVAFLKPVGGKRATGTMKLEAKNGKYYYSTPEASGELTEDVFADYYSVAGYSDNSWLLLEPCLNILNDDGHAVDFRCLVSLNGTGEWQTVLTYARIGGNGVASNISSGGCFNSAQDALEELLPGHGAEKLTEMNAIALKTAALVQRESAYPVSWLGLDLCVDRPSNQIYVIEANSKPAMKLVGKWELALIRAQYFKYILSNEDLE